MSVWAEKSLQRNSLRRIGGLGRRVDGVGRWLGELEPRIDGDRRIIYVDTTCLWLDVRTKTMLTTKRSYNGMVVAPHHLAAMAGSSVLREGGNAIEAMVAAAATIAVVYPHMNGLGGDNFWLLHTPGKTPHGIDACGGAAGLARPEFFRQHGLEAIPGRGPHAALTMAGAISGWQRALDFSNRQWGGRIPLATLLAEAIAHADNGVAVTGSLAENAGQKRSELENVPGFADTYFSGGAPIEEGTRHVQPKLAATLEQLSRAGLDDFYCGDLANAMANDLEAAGSPLRRDDFARHQSLDVTPLCLQVSGHRIFNMPPPTQGLASLILLGVYDRLGIDEAETFAFVHGIVEASKQAFLVRDKHVRDPATMTVDPASFLTGSALDAMADAVDPKQALPWPQPSVSGDTVWLGVVDSAGRAVSFIQSIYWEFGSGLVLPQTGITWQNRGTSFSLDEHHPNVIEPGKRPFHTIQPALAHLSDGRVMPYGTMGGEGQPQTQAMIFARHALFGQDLQQSINAPRWLLGRTWGSEATNLRIENRFDPSLFQRLRDAGHDLEIIGDFDSIMGHAGALVHHPDGLIEGAGDPRSDGAAIAL